MNQMTGPQGHFQGAAASPQYVPMRASKPNYGSAFNRFRQMANGGRSVQDIGVMRGGVRPQQGGFHPQPPAPSHMPGTVNRTPPPMPIPGIPGRGVPGRFPGGDVGHLPQPGGPVLGNGQQTVHGLLQAIMGDIGQGFTPDQFAALQAGNLPGQEHGDFAQGLGFGAGNNNVLQKLAQYLVQNTDGSYHMSAYGQDPMQQLIQQAIHGQNPQMPFHGPPAPPGPPGLPRPGGGGYGMPIPPGGYQPMPLGGRRTMQRGSGYLPPNLMQGLMGG